MPAQLLLAGLTLVVATFFSFSHAASLEGKLILSGIAATGDGDLNDKGDIIGPLAALETRARHGQFLLKGQLKTFDHELGYVSESFVRELSLNWQSQHWDITLGRVIEPWGRADDINPTDNLSPRLLRGVTSDRDEQRLGADMLKLQYIPNSAYSFTAIWAPQLQGSFIPEDIVRQVTQDDLAPDEGRSTYALRIDISRDNFDASLSYLTGTTLLPVLDFSGASVDVSRPEQRVVGGDFVWQLSDVYGLRGEFADIDLDLSPSQFVEAPRDYQFWVLGLERQFSGGWLLLSQYVRRNIDKANAAAGFQKTLQQLNNAIWFQSEQDDETLTLTLSRAPFYGKLSGEIGIAHSLTNDDGTFFTTFKWQLLDRLALHFHHQDFFGKDTTNFGALKDNRFTVVELRTTLPF